MHRRQEWMGHARISTTEIYADFMPADNEAELVDSAFAGAQPTGPDPVRWTGWGWSMPPCP
jgi:hypothetical protein